MNPTSHPAFANGRREKGFTLVELMVAATLSLVLLTGVLQIFLASKTSYNLQNGLGRLQENARFALDILSQNIGMAGFNTGTGTILSFNTANTTENTTENAALYVTQANGKASDVVEINYQSNTDCLGNATAGTATDRYYLNGTNLECLGNGSATPGVLAEGVENMQILYGEDSDNDAIANRYINAGSIVATNPITSIRIALLISTVDGIGVTDNAQYTLLNTPAIGPIGDKLLRRVFTRTILLRNQ
jgi:type IV pilus assembly protein PilW